MGYYCTPSLPASRCVPLQGPLDRQSDAAFQLDPVVDRWNSKQNIRTPALHVYPIAYLASCYW